MISIIISIILWIIFYCIYSSTKISPSTYRYYEKESRYYIFRIWHLILIILTLFIPFVNIIASAGAIFSVIFFINTEENVRFVPKGIVSKITNFLNKGL